MNKLLSKPIYVYLIAALYLIYKISFVPFNIVWIVAIGFLFSYTAITFCLSLLCAKVFRFNYSAPFLAIIWILILFHDRWVSTAEIFIRPPHVVHYKYMWLLFFLLGALATFITYKYKEYISGINKTLNVFFSISILIVFSNTLSLVYGIYHSINIDFDKHKNLTTRTPNDRDIVWILMDSYQSSSNLKSEFNYVNPLDTFLQHKNFNLLTNTKTRFNYTLASVSSIFNFDDEKEAYSYDYGQYALKNSAFIKVLKARGYSFSNLGFFPIGGAYSNKLSKYYDPTLLFKLIEGSAVQIYMQFHLLELYQRIWIDNEKQSVEYNAAVLKDFDKSLKLKQQQPQFIWAHLLIPHNPFYKYEHNKLIPINPSGVPATKKAFITYLSYGNLVLMDIFNKHPDLKNKIVVISGDHGTVLSRERYSPYCALYVPPGVDTTGLKNIKYISQIPAFILSLK